MFKKLFLGLLVLSICSLNATSQEEVKNFKELSREEIVQLSTEELLSLPFEDLLFLANKLGISIDELLSMKTSVASKTELTPRETPGIISVITENEIKKSGARDLTDVLRMVPGFEFGYDLSSVVGLGMRGNWVHEGKLLLMIDNQEMNDLFYFNNPFGNHFSVQQIKRIEIIRGPGSAMYGGNAELGVINIITRKGEDIKGVEETVTMGRMSEINGRQNFNILIGNKIKDWDFSIKGFSGKANRSQEKDITFALDTLDYSNNGSKITSENLNFGISNKNLSAKFIYDNYATDYTYETWKATNEFKTYLGEIKYKFDIGKKFSLTPLLSYKNTVPYYEEGWFRNVREARYKGNLSATYKPVDNLNILAGIEYYKDRCWMFEDSAGAFFYFDTTKNDISFNNASMYIQAVYKWKNLNFIAGARAENHDYYGEAYAPRVGLTGLFQDFHFKLLYSRAFRAPGIGNIDVSANLKTESTNVLELELGYKINANNFITANIYDITIKRPIIYFETGGDLPITDWGYRNGNKSGSQGLELEYRAMYNRGSITFNYSYYTVANKSIPDYYAVPGYSDKVLAFSPSKFGLIGIYQFTKDFSISPSLSYNGERYAYGAEPGFPDSIVVRKFEPYALLNLNLMYTNLFTNGLDLSFGVYDLLDKKPVILQPYNGWKSPYPGRAREFIATLTYRFKKN